MSGPACGHENRAGARFCDGCGAALAPTCASCGTELRVGAQYCDACGKPSRPGVTVTPRETQSVLRSPREYTPRHLAEKILQSRSALEGERKQVTVLFADVKSSLELAGSIDPEEWLRHHGYGHRTFSREDRSTRKAHSLVSSETPGPVVRYRRFRYRRRRCMLASQRERGGPVSKKELKRLLDAAKRFKMTKAQQEEQRRSFAYGNANIEDEHVTRAHVDQAAAELNAEQGDGED